MPLPETPVWAAGVKGPGPGLQHPFPRLDPARFPRAPALTARPLPLRHRDHVEARSRIRGRPPEGGRHLPARRPAEVRAFRFRRAHGKWGQAPGPCRLSTRIRPPRAGSQSPFSSAVCNTNENRSRAPRRERPAPVGEQSPATAGGAKRRPRARARRSSRYAVRPARGRAAGLNSRETHGRGCSGRRPWPEERGNLHPGDPLPGAPSSASRPKTPEVLTMLEVTLKGP